MLAPSAVATSTTETKTHLKYILIFPMMLPSLPGLWPDSIVVSTRFFT